MHDTTNTIPDPAMARIGARLFDLADTLPPNARDELLEAMNDTTPGRVRFEASDAAVDVWVATEQGSAHLARFDLATVGLHFVDGNLIYVAVVDED